MLRNLTLKLLAPALVLGATFALPALAGTFFTGVVFSEDIFLRGQMTVTHKDHSGRIKIGKLTLIDAPTDIRLFSSYNIFRDKSSIVNLSLAQSGNSKLVGLAKSLEAASIRDAIEQLKYNGKGVPITVSSKDFPVAMLITTNPVLDATRTNVPFDRIEKCAETCSGSGGSAGVVCLPFVGCFGASGAGAICSDNGYRKVTGTADTYQTQVSISFHERLPVRGVYQDLEVAVFNTYADQPLEYNVEKNVVKGTCSTDLEPRSVAKAAPMCVSSDEVPAEAVTPPTPPSDDQF